MFVSTYTCLCFSFHVATLGVCNFLLFLLLIRLRRWFLVLLACLQLLLGDGHLASTMEELVPQHHVQEFDGITARQKHRCFGGAVIRSHKCVQRLACCTKYKITRFKQHSFYILKTAVITIILYSIKAKLLLQSSYIFLKKNIAVITHNNVICNKKTALLKKVQNKRMLLKLVVIYSIQTLLYMYNKF